jgi:hypothetical protein
MRARLTLLLIFATACTRDNPAFDESTGTAGTTSDDDDPSTTLTSVDVESGEGQEAPDPACDLQPGVPLEIDLGPAGCADTPDSYDRYHPLVSIDGSTLLVGTCPQGSLGCSDQCEIAVPTPLSFSPLDLTGIAIAGDCLHVHARRQNPSNPDACRFQTVYIEGANDTTRRPIMIGRNSPGVVLPPVENSSPLVGFDPVLVHQESCSCAEFPDACCEDVATTRYALDIGGQTGQQILVQIGESVPVEFPNDTYTFTTLDAFQLGDCDKPTQVAWGLVAD